MEVHNFLKKELFFYHNFKKLLKIIIIIIKIFTYKILKYLFTNKRKLLYSKVERLDKRKTSTMQNL